MSERLFIFHSTWKPKATVMLTCYGVIKRHVGEGSKELHFLNIEFRYIEREIFRIFRGGRTHLVAFQ